MRDIKQQLDAMVETAAKAFNIRVGNGMSSSSDVSMLSAKITPVAREDTFGEFATGDMDAPFADGFYTLNINGVEGCIFDNTQTIAAQDADVYIQYTTNIVSYMSGADYLPSYQYFTSPVIYLSAVGVIPSDINPTLDFVTGATTTGTSYSPLIRIFADGSAFEFLSFNPQYGVVFLNTAL